MQMHGCFAFFILAGLAIAFPYVVLPVILVLFIIGIINNRKKKKGVLPSESATSKPEMETPVIPDDWRQPFGMWERKHHLEPGQDMRYSRSFTDDMTILQASNDFAEIRGTQGIVYDTTLNTCTCPDYEERFLPCKHIYLLARHTGKICDIEPMTPEKQGFAFVPHTPYAPQSSIFTSSYDPAEFDFEDEHEKEIERWRIKIENAEANAYRYDNPDKIVTAAEKVIALCDEFRDFCYSYSGGMSYYDNNEADTKERLEQDLQDYLDNEYDSAKAFYDEEQKHKRFLASSKRKIYNALSASEKGMTRKEVYALFSPDDQGIVLRILNQLVNEDKVSKEKQGNKLIFTAK